MLRRKLENTAKSDDCDYDAFALAFLRGEARRQAWTCAGLCGLILAALIATALAGTA